MGFSTVSLSPYGFERSLPFSTWEEAQQGSVSIVRLSGSVGAFILWERELFPPLVPIRWQRKPWQDS